MPADIKATAVKVVAFTRAGQVLSNDFSRYRSEIASQSTADMEVLGLGLFGDDLAVRSASRKCSVFS